VSNSIVPAMPKYQPTRLRPRRCWFRLQRALALPVPERPRSSVRTFRSCRRGLRDPSPVFSWRLRLQYPSRRRGFHELQLRHPGCRRVSVGDRTQSTLQRRSSRRSSRDAETLRSASNSSGRPGRIWQRRSGSAGGAIIRPGLAIGDGAIDSGPGTWSRGCRQRADR